MTEWLFVGDGEYEIFGPPFLREHFLSFGDIDISKAGVHRFSFRGFDPYDGPSLVLDVSLVTKSIAMTSDVCFRASLFLKHQNELLYSVDDCLADAASIYADRYPNTYGLFVFLGAPYYIGINRFKRYELILEVIGNDDRLSGALPTLYFSSAQEMDW